MFDVELSNSSKRFLKKCDRQIRDRILDKIEKLRIDPFPSDARRVEGRKEKTFRVKVGDYRILYCVYFELNKILVTDIDKRPRVYG